jgi:hypothetical protein
LQAQENTETALLQAADFCGSWLILQVPHRFKTLAEPITRRELGRIAAALAAVEGAGDGMAAMLIFYSLLRKIAVTP